ncbi:hypothetical protein KIN20_011696 [Parelaphostrongylus tenuis]|uniref:Uncharacterized protein n=1 Tax=Parelaphostrongylus tenuis TaxID=148309 RepID=A0AAD5MB88_PARTN|nr:hypothetical protein KIN20_011696 [Parelaphostrongylus tenuis]
MLEIYYEQMSYEILKESESYSIVNLVSDVGGQMGLWMGASVLTAIEIVIFLIDVFTITIRTRLLPDLFEKLDKSTDQRSDNDSYSEPLEKNHYDPS